MQHDKSVFSDVFGFRLFQVMASFPLMLKVPSLSACHKSSFYLLLLQGIAGHVDAQLAKYESSKRSNCCLSQTIAGLQVGSQ